MMFISVDNAIFHSISEGKIKWLSALGLSWRLPSGDSFIISEEILLGPSTSDLVELIVHSVQENSIDGVSQSRESIKQVLAVLSPLRDVLGLVDVESKRPSISSVSFGQVDHDNLNRWSQFCQELNQLSHLGVEWRSGRWGSDDKVTTLTVNLEVSKSLHLTLIYHEGVDLLADWVQAWFEMCVVSLQEENLVSELLRESQDNHLVLIHRFWRRRESSLLECSLLE